MNLSEKTKLKNTNYGPAVVYQDSEKTIPAKIKQQMPTGGDGTAYYGEETMTPAQKRKDTMLKKKYDDSDMKKNMQKQYGKEEGKKVYFATIRKQAMKEGLDDNDKPFVKKLVKNLRKGSKTHAKQADKLEKAMKENVNLKFHLGGNKKEISLNYGNTPIAYKSTEKFKSKTSPNTAINKALVQYKKKDDFVKKDIGEDIDEGVMDLARKVMKKISKTKMKRPNIRSYKNPKTGIVDLKKYRSDQEKYKNPVTGGGITAAAAFGIRKKMNEDISDEALLIQNWNTDDIKFTEVEAIDIIKPKPLKPQSSNWKEEVELDEGIKKKIIKKLVNKAIKKVKNKKIKVTGDVKPKKPEIKFPVRDAVSKKISKQIQTKSIVNQTKKANELSRKPVKGTTPVKVDLSKKLDIDKYIGGTPIKDIPKKKFVGKRPTGTFTDDPPPVKPPNMDTKLDDYLFGPDKDKPLKIFDKRPDMKSRKMYNPNTGLPKPKFNKKPKPKNTMDHYDWRDTLGEDWQKVNRKDKTDGLSKAAVKAYRRENPGSKLKTAVTKDPKKLKKGSKDAKRRLSFCRRMKGMKKKLTSAKTRRDPDSRINKALRRWNC